MLMYVVDPSLSFSGTTHRRILPPKTKKHTKISWQTGYGLAEMLPNRVRRGSKWMWMLSGIRPWFLFLASMSRELAFPMPFYDRKAVLCSPRAQRHQSALFCLVESVDLPHSEWR